MEGVVGSLKEKLDLTLFSVRRSQYFPLWHVNYFSQSKFGPPMILPEVTNLLDNQGHQRDRGRYRHYRSISAE